ncbi:NAD-dependent epimerase [Vandammella animalimorsus]|uniref:NAD-dependent epimerase n=1 Tax=Vandammella animalimorsus TaxID=2029117 RepID=UPI00325BF8EA
MKTIIVTGCAGFIGMHCAKALLQQDHEVLGFDDLNGYYDPSLKMARLANLQKFSNFQFEKIDIADRAAVFRLFEKARPARVLHLAAQAGVRYSIEQPNKYADSNLLGFGNILEGCRLSQVEHLVFASSSSVYGGNTKMPLSESDAVDHPISYYAATKKANEIMAHTYAHLYSIPCTGLRFFTVYGPWGRPDMALFKFTQSMLAGEPIELYGNGQLVRDFTYIDDIVEGVLRILAKPATSDMLFDPMNPNPSTSCAPYRIFNIGNSRPKTIMDYVAALELALGFEAKKIFLPLQPGDMKKTAADTHALSSWIGFVPNTPIRVGVNRFVQWYREYYKK